jgi:hypothetical protein
MSSATANLSYGFVFEEGFRFPWTDDEDNDIEEWWINNGFDNPIEYPYDEDYNLKKGITTEDVELWYINRRDWLKDNPLPVELIAFGSGWESLYILTVKNASSSSDCDPIKLEPEFMSYEKVWALRQRLLDFVATYGIKTTGEPKWWLSACNE